MLYLTDNFLGKGTSVYLIGGYSSDYLVGNFIGKASGKSQSGILLKRATGMYLISISCW